MIIGRQFAWAHLPKTGGDATYELFRFFPELIVFAHPRETNDKHNVFDAHERKLDGKLLAMNIRRLPSWMLSMSQHQAHYGLHPDHKHPPLDSSLMSSSAAADHALKSFVSNGRFHIDIWIRTEHLIEDFLTLMARFIDISLERQDAVRNLEPVNQMTYNHELDEWFTREQLETMYKANPLWASVERERYGDVLVSKNPVKGLRNKVVQGRTARSCVEATRQWRQPIDGSGVIAFQLDAPSPGWSSTGSSLSIHGWILTEQRNPVVVEATLHNKQLRTCVAKEFRNDVGARFPNLGRATQSGFSMQVGVMGLPLQFQISLEAVFDNGKRVCFAILEVKRNFRTFEYKGTLKPIMLTTGGRTGSSWLMRLLSQHPDIVIRPPHPYETRAGVYWLHMMKILSDPADHVSSTPRNNFTGRLSWIGHHPFFAPQVMQQPDLREWFESHYPEQIAALSLRSIDEFYKRVANSIGKEHPVYFAEKCNADHIPWLAWELYPGAREVILVRDFRDAMSSIFAFTDRNGKRGFGRDVSESKEDYIGKMRTNVLEFLRAWELRSDRALLVRYEDLVQRTESVVNQVLGYLGLGGNARKLVERAAKADARVDDHRTVGDAAASIGRWERDLDRSLQEACEVAFEEALVAFGYE